MVRSPHPSGGRRSRSSASGLRFALLALLVVLTAVVAWRFPVASEEFWPRPHRFEPDAAVCKAEREDRQWAWYEVPEEAGWATVAAVAGKLSVEERWICEANGWESRCGGQPVAAGDRLVVPLHGGAVEAARGAERPGEGSAARRLGDAPGEPAP